MKRFNSSMLAAHSLRGALFLLILFSSVVGAKSNLAYQKLLAKRVVEGKPVWLNGEKEKTLGIYHHAVTPSVAGGMVIVPGAFENANSNGVIRPLRLALPEMGWASLSISVPAVDAHQLPADKQSRSSGTTDYEKLSQAVGARIQVGVDFLAEKGYRNILIVGHGTGGIFAGKYLLENKKNKAIKGLIMISSYAPLVMPGYKKLNAKIPKLPMPVLDLFGSHDDERVAKQVRLRMSKSRSRSGDIYWARVVYGSDYQHYNQTTAIVKSIRAWLLVNQSSFRIQGNDVKEIE